MWLFIKEITQNQEKSVIIGFRQLVMKKVTEGVTCKFLFNEGCRQTVSPTIIF